MFESWEPNKRINEAKRLTARLIDHGLYLLDIRENNALIVYSDTLSKQIPKSYAANAFNTWREAMHQIEIVRLCALWDQPHINNETITTVLELIDSNAVIEQLAEETRSYHANVAPTILGDGGPDDRALLEQAIKERNEQFGDEQSARARTDLKKAIAFGRATHKSSKLKSIRNLRNKHVAHYLAASRAEKNGGPIAPMKVGDEREVIDASLEIIQTFYLWVNGVSFSFADSRAIDRKCAEALWLSCSFKL